MPIRSMLKMIDCQKKLFPVCGTYSETHTAFPPGSHWTSNFLISQYWRSNDFLLNLLQVITMFMDHTVLTHLVAGCLASHNSNCSNNKCYSDGASQSGLFCAVSYLVERLKLEQEVDVFQSTKHVRINRPQFVPNMVSTIIL